MSCPSEFTEKIAKIDKINFPMQCIKRILCIKHKYINNYFVYSFISLLPTVFSVKYSPKHFIFLGITPKKNLVELAKLAINTRSKIFMGNEILINFYK